MGRNQRDEPIAQMTFTNWTNDVDMDCDSSADAVICDVVATMAKHLMDTGSLGGSVSE